MGCIRKREARNFHSASGKFSLHLAQRLLAWDQDRLLLRKHGGIFLLCNLHGVFFFNLLGKNCPPTGVKEAEFIPGHVDHFSLDNLGNWQTILIKTAGLVFCLSHTYTHSCYLFQPYLLTKSVFHRQCTSPSMSAFIANERKPVSYLTLPCD